MGFLEPYQIFEKQWAHFNEVEDAVACSTGTAALHLALVALGIGEGDEVIVPEFTMIACANAVRYTGATPVFVDCSTDDLNMDPNLIEAKITDKTKAIMVVHVYGKPCDMDHIINIAEHHDLRIVEDAAEAHGARYKGKLVGSFGDIGCFSFYKNKIIAAEEGGVCTTNQPILAEKMRSLRSHCFDDGHTFLHTGMGFNYRMANAQARILLDQDWDSLVAERKQEDGSVKWVHQYLFDTTEQRAAAYAQTVERGFNPRLFFKPMSMQPMYLDEDYKRLNAYDFSQRGFYLPWK